MASGGREKSGDNPLGIFVLRSHTLAALRRVGITTAGQARTLSDPDISPKCPDRATDALNACGESLSRGWSQLGVISERGGEKKRWRKRGRR
jgi:hypothetical protein